MDSLSLEQTVQGLEEKVARIQPKSKAVTTPASVTEETQRVGLS